MRYRLYKGQKNKAVIFTFRKDDRPYYDFRFQLKNSRPIEFIEACLSLPRKLYRTGVCRHVRYGVCFRVCWQKALVFAFAVSAFLHLPDICFCVCPAFVFAFVDSYC